jgi:hypothetical protein
MAYTIGLDYGTGHELGTVVYGYESGSAGILLDKSDHNIARQNPADYLKGLEVTILAAVKQAKKAHQVYQQLYILYKKLHDAFGVRGNKADISNGMKDLLFIKEKANA